MAIFIGSRYAYSPIYMDRERRIKHTELLVENPFKRPQQDDLEITVTVGTRLDTLAFEYYGDSDMQWIILYANPRLVTPLDLKIGTTLIIPNPERVMTYGTA